MTDPRLQAYKLDELLAELARLAWQRHPSVKRLRELAEALAWEWEPIRASVTGEPALPDLREVDAAGHRAPRRN